MVEARQLGARGAINRIKWAEGGLAGTTIWILHRGAPNDRKGIPGETIIAIHRGNFELPDGTMIPWHRVQRIERDGATLWERNAAMWGRSERGEEE